MTHEATLRLCGACIAAGLTFLSLVAMAAPQHPRLMVDVEGSHVTVIAHDVPVREVLEEIAMQSGIIVYSKASLDMRATYSIQDESLPIAIRRILKHRNFTLHYVSDSVTGKPVFGSRLWILADDVAATASDWSAGEPARDWTLRYAAGDPETKRLLAVSNLAAQQDKAAVDEQLSTAMNDPSMAVREEAVYGLGNQNNAASIGYLKNALYDPVRRVRLASIAALVETGSSDAITALSDLLNDRDASIRAEVIHALADIGGDLASQYLQQALADTNAINRETAAGYLAELANTERASRF